MKKFETLTKFEQFAEFLEEEIAKGVYAPGDKIPSERDLGKRHGMSFMTVNKALSNLVSKGILERRHGTGTFVAYPKRNLFDQMLAIAVNHETDVHCKYPTLFHQNLDSEKYITTFYDTNFTEKSLESFEEIIKEKPRALVLYSFNEFPFEVLEQVDESTQLIFIHRYERDQRFENASYILGSMERVGYKSTKALIRQGCKRIAVFSFALDGNQFAPDYYNGCLEALNEAGLEPLTYLNTDIADEKEYINLLKPENRPDGIVARNDFRLLPFIKLMRKSGISYPDDIKIVGCQNSPWAEAYELTSVTEREDLIVQKVFEALENNENVAIDIEPELVYRASCPEI